MLRHSRASFGKGDAKLGVGNLPASKTVRDLDELDGEKKDKPQQYSFGVISTVDDLSESSKLDNTMNLNGEPRHHNMFSNRAERFNWSEAANKDEFGTFPKYGFQGSGDAVSSVGQASVRTQQLNRDQRSAQFPGVGYGDLPQNNDMGYLGSKPHVNTVAKESEGLYTEDPKDLGRLSGRAGTMSANDDLKRWDPDRERSKDAFLKDSGPKNR